MFAFHIWWVLAIECWNGKGLWMMSLVKWTCWSCTRDGTMLSAKRCALECRLYWCFIGRFSSNSVSSLVMMCGWCRLGCLGIPCSAKLVVLGAVVLVCGWVVPALADNFGCVGVVSNSQTVLMAFSSVVATGVELWYLAIVWWLLGGIFLLRLQEVGYDVEMRWYWWFVLCWFVAWQLNSADNYLMLVCCKCLSQHALPMIDTY